MDFDDLQALLWAQEHGSLQRASRATGMSRTTLRRRLDRLEAAVGRRVYLSGHDGIALTSAGRALVTEGAQLVAARNRLLERIQNAGARDSLHVLLQVGLPPRAVAIATSMFCAMIPDVRVVIDVDADPASRVHEAFDAILHWGDAPIVTTGYTRTLRRASFAVMGSPGYLEQHGIPETPADLADHRLLHLQGTEPRWPCADGSFVDITPAHACADLYLLGMLTGQGLGLAFMPVRGPGVDGGLGFPGDGGPLVHPSIEALQPVLTEYIQADRRLRLDMPEPADDDSAAAMLIRIAKTFDQLPEQDAGARMTGS